MPACGAVIFTNNICQLEARLSGQRAIASVMIFALDDLIFGHNECWVDGQPLTAVVDALLVRGTAAGHEQSPPRKQQDSLCWHPGFAVGALNITSQNISTYCLFATGTLQPAIFNNNLSLLPSQVCQAQARDLKLNVTT